MTVRVAALLATHNRVAQTMHALEALEAQQAIDTHVDIVLCDAGSTDGTVQRVRDHFPAATVLETGSDIFWNAGMRHAFEVAIGGAYDFYLWLNDDTILDPDALSTLIATERDPLVRRKHPAIIVGAVRDPTTGALTYGGVRRSDPRRPLRFTLIPPGSQPREAETMHGNCVLVPSPVVQRIGVLDAAFTHGMGDFDYGLRARSAGFSVWLTPGTVGVCSRNSTAPSATGFREHLVRLTGPKGLPPREWALFSRRWAGPLWPLYAVSPFVGRSLAWGWTRILKQQT